MTPRTDIQKAARDLAQALGIKPRTLAAYLADFVRPSGPYSAASQENAAALDAFLQPDPCIVGRIDGAFTFKWDPVTRKSTREPLAACIMSAHEIGFAGMRFVSAHKAGASLHDGESLAAFTTDDDEDDFFAVWIDAAGNVHADSTGEVEQLRARYARHQLAQQAAAKPAKRAKRAA